MICLKRVSNAIQVKQFEKVSKKIKQFEKVISAMIFTELAKEYDNWLYSREAKFEFLHCISIFDWITIRSHFTPT